MKPFLPSKCRDKICGALKIYREIEKNTKILQLETGIRCPDGCGSCCLNQNIEAAPIEFFPLAYYLFELNMQDEVLNVLQKNVSEKICVFFSRENYAVGKWACTMHKLRPLVCRLFGFYAVKDKFNCAVLGSCKEIKKSFPEEYQKAFTFIKTNAAFMCMGNYYYKMQSVGSDYENKLMPINEALKIAIEAIGFEISKGFWCNNFPKKLR